MMHSDKLWYQELGGKLPTHFVTKSLLNRNICLPIFLYQSAFRYYPPLLNLHKLPTTLLFHNDFMADERSIEQYRRLFHCDKFWWQSNDCVLKFNNYGHSTLDENFDISLLPGILTTFLDLACFFYLFPIFEPIFCHVFQIQ